ncbi:Uncharacterised protein [Vibrio cholerae]|nr:Uncharacterised protein [Vibrio cholerae]CSI52831.1 Uncharacterised protein [Vibrio cholerae]
MFLSFSRMFSERTYAIVEEISRLCSSSSGLKSSNAGTMNSPVKLGRR